MNYAIWVTTECNLQCKYCYEGQEKPKLHLDKSKCDEILEFIKKDMKDRNENELWVDFHGGEPLLQWKAIKYFIEELNKEYGDKLSLIYGTTTNATIMNDEILAFILKYIPNITVSLDGSSRVHNLLRPFKNGEGSYSAAINNSKRLLTRLPNTRVRMTFTPDTVQYLAEGVIELISQGFRLIVPAMDLFDKRWDDYMMRELKAQIIKIKEYICGMQDIAVSLCESIPVKGQSCCTGGQNSINIYTDGSLYPCMMAGGVEEFKIGHISSGVDKGKLSGILSHNAESYEECQQCDMKNMCNGTRCKMINWLINGEYIVPSAAECECNHILAELNGFGMV